MITQEMTYIDELNEICNRNRGILRAEDVVEYAKNPNTQLHSKFTWDDDEAAHQWRLQQARNIIRVSVVYEKRTNTEIKAFVSMMDDRYEDGGGYRLMTTVLGDKEMRERILLQAKEELLVFKQKYSHLNELAKVFEAIDKIRGEVSPRQEG